jgi:hypothetical protein
MFCGNPAFHEMKTRVLQENSFILYKLIYIIIIIIIIISTLELLRL